MRVDVSLQGYRAGMNVIQAGKSVKDPLGVLSTFLQKYNTAKIIFVLDTHCGDNGRFVYTGTTPETYAACSLIEVTNRLFACLPS